MTRVGIITLTCIAALAVAFGVSQVASGDSTVGPTTDPARALVAKGSVAAARIAKDGVTVAEYDAAFTAYRSCLTTAGFVIMSTAKDPSGIQSLTAKSPTASSTDDAAFSRCSADWDVINATYSAARAPDAATSERAEATLATCLAKVGLTVEKINTNPTAAQPCVDAYSASGWRALPGVVDAAKQKAGG